MTKHQEIIQKTLDQAEVRKPQTETIFNESKNLLAEYDYSSDVIKPVEFVIDGFISNRLTLIAGAPGVGKSTCLVSMAAIAAGIMFTEGITAELSRTVFYVTEDAEQIERILYGMRAQKLTTWTHEQIKEKFKIIHARRRPAHEISQMIEAVRSRGITKHQSGYAVEPLIVLDTSNATLDMDNENDNSEAGKAISAIKESLGNAALWIVGHTAKAIKRADLESLSFRGAGAFEGDCHATCYLFQDEQAGKNIRFLALGKHRYVSSYQEMKIDTVLGRALVSTAWGSVQDCWYCVGIPQCSSATQREQLKQAARDDAIDRNEQKLKKKIIETIRNRTQKGEVINRSGVKRLMSGKGETLSRLITELIDDGRISETKAEGKRGYDLQVSQNPDEDRFDLDEGTIGNDAIDQSIRNLTRESFPAPLQEQTGMIDDGHILPHQSTEIRLRE
jgi:hypothetical protein